jgi:hypothetical protein
LVEWNEFITVRSEERAIYTYSRNLTVQIYVGTADVDLGTTDLYRKHCSYKVKVTARRPTSGLPTYVRIADASKQPRQPLGQASALLTRVGTADVLSHRTG